MLREEDFYMNRLRSFSRLGLDDHIKANHREAGFKNTRFPAVILREEWVSFSTHNVGRNGRRSAAKGTKMRSILASR
ncbi:hypothetical protein GCM10025771_13830 [Niveibacterium umoris]